MPFLLDMATLSRRSHLLIFRLVERRGVHELVLALADNKPDLAARRIDEEVRNFPELVLRIIVDVGLIEIGHAPLSRRRCWRGSRAACLLFRLKLRGGGKLVFRLLEGQPVLPLSRRDLQILKGHGDLLFANAKKTA